MQTPETRLDIWVDTLPRKGRTDIETWISRVDEGSLDFTKKPIGIYAHIIQDGREVREASVKATVYAVTATGMEEIDVLTLKDSTTEQAGIS